MIDKKLTIWCILVLMFVNSRVTGQNSPLNYDESRVPSYSLPELLITNDGATVANRRKWERKRRPEVLDLFTTHMFGRVPNLSLIHI